jgi:hypothetical protein
MALRRKGNFAPSSKPKLLEVRPLTREDLSLLKTGYQIKPNRVQSFRDSHHRVARLLAAGLHIPDVAEATGYAIASIYAFRTDPAFKELMAEYRPSAESVVRDAIAEYEGLLISNRMKAERKLADRLDDEDEDRITTRDLITLARDAADRTGFGKRATNVNVNVDMAKALEEARLRIDQSRLRTIDNAPSSPATLSRPAVNSSGLQPSRSQQASPLRPALINRRGF